MREPMKSLLELQKLDTEMERLRRAEQDAEQGLESEQRAFDQAIAALGETEENVKKLQMGVDKRNVELAALEESIQKLEGQKMTLKTNEDYAAMQKQIDARQAEVAALEEKALEAMEVVDQGRSHLPARKKELEERKAALDAARKRVTAEQEELREEVAKLQARWEEIAGSTNRDGVTRYVQIRDRRGGRGLARLSPDNKCQECFMKVRVQVMNDLLKGSVVECPSCRRLLYTDA